ncbi:uncharacterized protein [Miscanthus floridulus]|uniref:uncharacterized protein isoform X2 n=1 Tax=Miscanthus floridulus TaxID=154761 RepID=UPI0034575BBF
MEDQIPLKWIPMFKPQLNKADTSSTATTPATLLSPQVSSSSCARYHTSLWLRLRGSRPFPIPCQLMYHHGNRRRLSIDYVTRFVQQCYLTFQTSGAGIFCLITIALLSSCTILLYII